MRSDHAEEINQEYQVLVPAFQRKPRTHTAFGSPGMKNMVISHSLSGPILPHLWRCGGFAVGNCSFTRCALQLRQA